MNNNYLSYTDSTYIPDIIHLKGILYPNRIEVITKTPLGEKIKSSFHNCHLFDVLTQLQELTIHSKKLVNENKYILHCIGILSFESAYIVEDLPIKNNDIPIFEFIIAECKEINTDDFIKKITSEKISPLDLPHCELFENTSEAYNKNYSRIIEHFKAGDVYEIVPSRKIEFKTNVNKMFQYLQRPMASQKAPYRYALEFLETKICGASPEILVDIKEKIVTSRPISGSIRRNSGSDTLTEKELHELQKLYQSEKEKCELDMLIDLARNDLNRVCTNVIVSDYRKALILEHIIHTQATVTGKLKPGFTQIQSLLSCLNAGTLVGAPKRKAMEIIAELETHPRGYYGGNLVHMKPDGNLTAIILIRTAFLSKDILKIQAGSSVVVEANEQYEFWECGSKLKNILKMINQEKLCFTDCNPPQIVSNNLVENSDKLSNQLNYNKFYAKQEFDENSIQNNSSKYKLLMIDNFDSFTYNLISLFEKCGCNVDVIKNNVKEFDFSAYDGVLLSPGPSHPKQAGYLIKHVKNLIDNKPLFGVCLGFQAIIESLGGSISRMQNPLHGKSRRCYVNKSNVLFHNLPHQFNVARYHSLFADKIPNEVNIVAYDENKIPLALECFSNGRNLCAVQFHPESFLTGEVGIQIINNWLRNIKHESK